MSVQDNCRQGQLQGRPGDGAVNRRVLEYLGHHMQVFGRGPTASEVALALGFNPVFGASNARYRLKRMEEGGLVVRAARSLRPGPVVSEWRAAT